MIQIGQWSGHYTYSSQRINKIKGYELTNFSIEIVSINNDTFFGTVQDDLSTGGTEGVGEIRGIVAGDKVEFVKRMPVMTLIIDRNGTRKTLNKKHPPIYYFGQFSSDKKSISGTWKFKFGFIWYGIIPIPMVPITGTWTMKLTE